MTLSTRLPVSRCLRWSGAGIDNGVVTKVFHAIVLVSIAGLAIVIADWVISFGETMVVGRTGERLLYTLRVKIFAHCHGSASTTTNASCPAGS